MHSPPPPRELSLKVLAVLVLSVLLLTLLLHRYVFAVYVIQGSSMSPTLKDGDTALVNMLVWRLGSLDRGEIVLVRDGLGGYATKRIVGLPRERIDFKANSVYVNGRRLRETYLPKETATSSECPVFILRANEYLVLGDNRADSYDSRIYGPVSKAAIKGSVHTNVLGLSVDHGLQAGTYGLQFRTTNHPGWQQIVSPSAIRSFRNPP